MTWPSDRCAGLSVQVLQVNMYYEKIYLFLWLWMFALAIATLASLARWVWLLLPAQRNAFVLKLRHDARHSTHAHSRDPHPGNRETTAYVADTYLGVCTRTSMCVIVQVSISVYSHDCSSTLYSVNRIANQLH